MDQLPIFLNVRGRRVLVLGEGAGAEAKRRLLENAGAEITNDEAGALVAFVAMDDAEAARETAERLRARGILVNVVDRPQLSDFTMPAIVDRTPVLVAVGTGGASAGLAKALRERLEALLPATLGRLARTIAAAKPKLGARFSAYDARRAFWDSLLAPGGALDPLGSHESADAVIERALAGAAAETASVNRIVVRSADPDALTLGEARLLSRADVVAHAENVPPAILDRARRDARRVREAEATGAEGHVVILEWRGA
jgi:uroporphyrin-III C-methyltransferase/precorrin-2 dehydrogenase/sirohydrochlorin ferrochelatase